MTQGPQGTEPVVGPGAPGEPPGPDPWAAPLPPQPGPPAWWMPHDGPALPPAAGGTRSAAGHARAEGTVPGDGDGAAGLLDTLGHPVADPAPRGVGGLVLGAIVLALVAGLLGGVVGAWWAGRSPSLTDPAASLGAVPAGSLSRPPDSVAGIAQRVLPVVVSIDVRAANGGGTGSGFIVRADGYILTNNHVVADAAAGGTMTVHFNDGSSADGRIVGRSPAYDLAVVKVARTGLPVAVLGDSDSVVVGDQCIAVGSPLGLAGTVTSGIISATHRPVTTGSAAGGSEQSYLSALQTDAAINPGNSGGPLVDGQGRVIGVNSAIATLSSAGSGQSGSIGLGFSIPINQARRVAEQLIQRGYATHPVIGASLDPSYTGVGVRLRGVTPGGGADRAGLRAGDVVVSVGGVAVSAPAELIVAIRSKQPGDTVTLGYQRSGSGTATVTVTLGQARG